MGLWNFTKRMFQGKPVFDSPGESDPPSQSNDPNAGYSQNQPAEKPGQAKTHQSHRYDDGGNKQPPAVVITSCRNQVVSSGTQVWATIYNKSPINVHIDRVTLCGVTTTINCPLAPNEQRDFMVYGAPLPASPSDCYAQVYVKDKGTGEYFAAQHMVKFTDNQDGTFSPQSFSHMMTRDANAADPL